MTGSGSSGGTNAFAGPVDSCFGSVGSDLAGPSGAGEAAATTAGAATGSTRVKRGGNWHSKGAFTASSSRRGQDPTYTVDAANGGMVWANGYRLVCPAVAK